MKILHIDSSILTNASTSRVLSAAIVNDLRTTHPHATVLHRDLITEAIPHLDGAIAAGFRPINTAPQGQHAAEEHRRSEQLVTEFLGSDVIVIGAPMYNFCVASQLKSWLDRVVQPGRTFRYADGAPLGLAAGKRVFIASTRGGAYASGPAAGLDFQETYLRAVFGFLGITNVHIIRAENLNRGVEAKQQSIEAALASVNATLHSALPV